MAQKQKDLVTRIASGALATPNPALIPEIVQAFRNMLPSALRFAERSGQAVDSSLWRNYSRFVDSLAERAERLLNGEFLSGEHRHFLDDIRRIVPDDDMSPIFGFLEDAAERLDLPMVNRNLRGAANQIVEDRVDLRIRPPQPLNLSQEYIPPTIPTEEYYNELRTYTQFLTRARREAREAVAQVPDQLNRVLRRWETQRSITTRPFREMEQRELERARTQAASVPDLDDRVIPAIDRELTRRLEEGRGSTPNYVSRLMADETGQNEAWSNIARQAPDQALADARRLYEERERVGGFLSNRDSARLRIINRELEARGAATGWSEAEVARQAREFVATNPFADQWANADQDVLRYIATSGDPNIPGGNIPVAQSWLQHRANIAGGASNPTHAHRLITGQQSDFAMASDETLREVIANVSQLDPMSLDPQRQGIITQARTQLIARGSSVSGPAGRQAPLDEAAQTPTMQSIVTDDPTTILQNEWLQDTERLLRSRGWATPSPNEQARITQEVAAGRVNPENPISTVDPAPTMYSVRDRETARAIYLLRQREYRKLNENEARELGNYITEYGIPSRATRPRPGSPAARPHWSVGEIVDGPTEVEDGVSRIRRRSHRQGEFEDLYEDRIGYTHRTIEDARQANLDNAPLPKPTDEELVAFRAKLPKHEPEDNIHIRDAKDHFNDIIDILLRGGTPASREYTWHNPLSRARRWGMAREEAESLITEAHNLGLRQWQGATKRSLEVGNARLEEELQFFRSQDDHLIRSGAGMFPRVTGKFEVVPAFNHGEFKLFNDGRHEATISTYQAGDVVKVSSIFGTSDAAQFYGVDRGSYSLTRYLGGQGLMALGEQVAKAFPTAKKLDGSRHSGGRVMASGRVGIYLNRPVNLDWVRKRLERGTRPTQLEMLQGAAPWFIAGGGGLVELLTADELEAQGPEALARLLPQAVNRSAPATKKFLNVFADYIQKIEFGGSTPEDVNKVAQAAIDAGLGNYKDYTNFFSEAALSEGFELWPAYDKFREGLGGIIQKKMAGWTKKKGFKYTASETNTIRAPHGNVHTYVLEADGTPALEVDFSEDYLGGLYVHGIRTKSEMREMIAKDLGVDETDVPRKHYNIFDRSALRVLRDEVRKQFPAATVTGVRITGIRGKTNKPEQTIDLDKLVMIGAPAAMLFAGAEEAEAQAIPRALLGGAQEFVTRLRPALRFNGKVFTHPGAVEHEDVVASLDDEARALYESLMETARDTPGGKPRHFYEVMGFVDDAGEFMTRNEVQREVQQGFMFTRPNMMGRFGAGGVGLALPATAQQYAPQIEEEAKKNNVPPGLVAAFLAIESNFNPQAVGDGGDARGMAQINRRFWPEEYKKAGDPNFDIAFAAREAGKYYKRYDGNWDASYAAYNGGQARGDAYFKTGRLEALSSVGRTNLLNFQKKSKPFRGEEPEYTPQEVEAGRQAAYSPITAKGFQDRVGMIVKSSQFDSMGSETPARQIPTESSVMATVRGEGVARSDAPKKVRSREAGLPLIPGILPGPRVSVEDGEVHFSIEDAKHRWRKIFSEEFVNDLGTMLKVSWGPEAVKGRFRRAAEDIEAGPGERKLLGMRIPSEKEGGHALVGNAAARMAFALWDLLPTEKAVTEATEKVSEAFQPGFQTAGQILLGFGTDPTFVGPLAVRKLVRAASALGGTKAAKTFTGMLESWGPHVKKEMSQFDKVMATVSQAQKEAAEALAGVRRGTPPLVPMESGTMQVWNRVFQRMSSRAPISIVGGIPDKNVTAALVKQHPRTISRKAADGTYDLLHYGEGLLTSEQAAAWQKFGFFPRQIVTSVYGDVKILHLNQFGAAVERVGEPRGSLFYPWHLLPRQRSIRVEPLDQTTVDNVVQQLLGGEQAAPPVAAEPSVLADKEARLRRLYPDDPEKVDALMSGIRKLVGER